mgnify:CR=1 FL=1
MEAHTSALQLVEILAVDGVGLALCHGGEPNEILELSGPDGVSFVAVTQLDTQIREEIGHDTGEAGAAHFQSFQQGGGIGVEDGVLYFFVEV